LILATLQHLTQEKAETQINFMFNIVGGGKRKDRKIRKKRNFSLYIVLAQDQENTVLQLKTKMINININIYIYIYIDVFFP